MALSNAERQRRFIARLKARAAKASPHAGEEPPRAPQPRRRSRPERWQSAVEELRTLQAECQDWLDSLPETLADSPTEKLLEQVAALDLDELAAIELPPGFGRD